MSFDFVYKKEWEGADVKSEEVEEARILLRSIFTNDFIEAEKKRSNNLGSDPITINYRKHPILLYLESPFLDNICNLIHLTQAFLIFKEGASIPEYISRMKKSGLFKASVFELQLASFLHGKEIPVKPSHKINNSEIDIYIPEQTFGREIFIECKTYNPKQNLEEPRRSLFGALFKCLDELPQGFIICFKSYIDITEDNLKMIKGKIKGIIKNAPEYYKNGETVHELFFGHLEILYAEFITEKMARQLRGEYNEFAIKTMVSQKYLERGFESFKDPDSIYRGDKIYENALAFDLPIANRGVSRSVNYVNKAKSDIATKIKQHKKRIKDKAEVCIVLENIPTEDFVKLKKEVDTGLYKKYKFLSVLFVTKIKNSKELKYEIFPLKVSQSVNKLITEIGC